MHSFLCPLTEKRNRNANIEYQRKNLNFKFDDFFFPTQMHEQNTMFDNWMLINALGSNAVT